MILCVASDVIAPGTETARRTPLYGREAAPIPQVTVIFIFDDVEALVITSRGNLSI